MILVGTSDQDKAQRKDKNTANRLEEITAFS